MSDSLQWIRFKNGKEKQVPKHIALDASVQKSQNFAPIDAPGGNVVEGIILPEASKKKDVVAVAANPDDIVEKPALTDKDLYEQFKGGKSFKDIARELGIHWKAAEKQINDYKAVNPEVAEILTNETPNT